MADFGTWFDLAQAELLLRLGAEAGVRTDAEHDALLFLARQVDHHGLHAPWAVDHVAHTLEALEPF